MSEQNRNVEFHFKDIDDKRTFEFKGNPGYFVDGFTMMLISRYQKGNEEDKKYAQQFAKLFLLIYECFEEYKDKDFKADE